MTKDFKEEEVITSNFNLIVFLTHLGKVCFGLLYIFRIYFMDRNLISIRKS